ncbi:hypothetical protein [Photobacterium leiognathi]|uniref:hypothetical protein n=1 Tax=Photobacterium leiognathi TaxID=553611 RepID=UPI002980B670|nr:hypothetical protein [Photobacterium leiognathi]
MMQELNQMLLTELVFAIEEGASYRDQLDLSRFLAMGASMEQIYLIDAVISQLRRQPYLSQCELESQYGVQIIRLTIGCVERFKKRLNFDDYTYRDWLKTNKVSEDEPLCLPYRVYQYFSDEIRRDFTRGKRLIDNLQVQLGTKQARYFKFKCGTIVDIPIDVAEMMRLILISRYGRYTRFNINLAESILTLINQTQAVDVEVRLYTSSVTGNATHAISLIDDLPASNRSRNSKSTMLMEHLALCHKSKINGVFGDKFDFYSMEKNDD